MYEGNYFTYNDDGKYIEVLPFDKCIDSLKQRFDDMKNQIECQKKMISEMNDAMYKEKEMVQLVERNKELQQKLNDSFVVTEDQWDKISAWRSEHNREHGALPTAGERYKYIFYPTGLGTICLCKCCSCGEEFDFTDESFG